MEGLGKKLQDARLARNLTIDDAARMTKIRPARLQEIENEDFSEFSSLAYAKGFLLIYGKFLNVDVSPYLEAFETSESVTVDGYAYLQDNPVPKPSRPVVSRRRSSSPAGGGGSGIGRGRGSFLPFIIGVAVLVGGFIAMKWILEVQRLKPSPQQLIGATPVPTESTDKIVAPKALPVEQAPQPVTPTPSPVITQPTAAAPSPIPEASIFEPEVRRAEPVHPEDMPKAKPSPAPPVRKPIRPQIVIPPGTQPSPRVIPPGARPSPR
jgi:cytoskeletal protein RodZ